ncbi:sodium/iodide cotransporter, putative [Pediculus humanus corporis]|uniref:Sodium/iodide cotransporter, putative n=1 Tax=Pediculus humanus subsp. corporis TaxID=121224 RepID=E0VBP8_PEDHC|nr:sodium/iodide cotransporter, putative [Pediculus humanus corporis]EEB10804.1 sodium/iodide cotransporter, putative [Pediculus humanus corporis]
MRTTNLTIIDYVTFVAALFVTLAVPIYSGYKPRRDDTKKNFVFATGGKISMGMMILSMLRGILGVRMFLGNPSEMFYNGTRMYEVVYSIMLTYLLASYCFIPVYYNLGITSVYQYLDMRFKSQCVRCLASGFYIFRNILNTSVIIFTPCVALKFFMGFSYSVSIITLTAISTFCAFLGGLKSIMLTDVMQVSISIVCVIIIIIKGTIDVGGFMNVYQTNKDNGRFIFFDFNFDPEIRVTTVSALLGQFFISTFTFGCQQHFVQRYASMKSLEAVRRSFWIVLPLTFFFFTLYWVAGAVIYANYAYCDPLTLGEIKKMDEIVLFYVNNAFHKFPGMIGIVLSALFNGSISLALASLNSMGTVAWEDFLKRIPLFKNFNDRQELITIKILTTFFGILIIGVAFGVATLPGLIESSMLMTSASSGPLLGVFVLASFFPYCNWKGAVSGMISSLVITLFLMLGRLYTRGKKVNFLPLSIEGCTNTTFDAITFTPEEYELILGKKNSSAYTYFERDTIVEDKGFLDHLFGITYMYYSVIGTLTCVLFGVVISALTGGSNYAEDYDEKLIHPIARKINNFFTGKFKKYDVTNPGDKSNSKKKINLKNHYDDDDDDDDGNIKLEKLVNNDKGGRRVKLNKEGEINLNYIPEKVNER